MKLAALFLLPLLLAACSEPPPPVAAPRLVRTLIVGQPSASISPPGGEGRQSAAFSSQEKGGGMKGDTALDGTDRSYSGEVRARIETTLGFRIAGKIIERRADVGKAVKRGQVLARLDPADAGLQAAQAEAQRALAAAELSRYRDLRAKNFISASALDARETAFNAAQAQAQLAKNQVAYTNLVADRAGVIGLVLAEPGQVVTAGQPVFRMAPDGDREIAIALPESEVSGFKLGQPAKVTIWAAPGAVGKPLEGRLREVSPVADPVTRTYAARVSLKNADPLLPLGMTASVRFPSAAGATKLIVPLAAIIQQGDRPAVWKVGADNTLSLQPVSVAEFTDRGAVVTGGLTGGEQIVAAGVNLLAAGEKVRIATPALPAAPVKAR